jgi:Ti-type conjugative transfer relaxase TraA
MAVTNERTGESYNYIQKGDSAYHAVLLPDGVDERFKDPRILWNAAEKRETRINSQVALEGVIALPDDACITMEDRIEIAHRAAHHFFVRHGLAVQVNIHEPHDDEDHNWHAHFLATTRTFTPGGQALGEKAREYMARYREGNLHSGEEYRKIQNDYFAEKGYDLRVDENGIIAQAHLGPVRLRARASEMMQSHLEKITANQNASRDPAKILEHLTERNSVFTRNDVERYVRKHVPANEAKAVREAFWRQKGLVQLYEKDAVLGKENGIEKHETPKTTLLYTTVSVKSEEDRILRIANRLQAKDGVFGLTSNYSKGRAIAQEYSLSAEQLVAFEDTVLGQRLVCIQGRAGTGKSHVMAAIREMIESNKVRVRGLAPTASVAKDLEAKGFEGAQNLHKFLFQQKNGIDALKRKEVLMIDEAGMVGNTVMQELLKIAWDKGAQVILVGDDRQLPSVDRGGLFKVFCERYGAHELTEVRRQTKAWQKTMSETLSQEVSSKGVHTALTALEQHERLHWVETKDDALIKLVEVWKQDRLQERSVGTEGSLDVASFFIMEHRNHFARVLNEMIRNVRKEWGELSGTDASGTGSPGTEVSGTEYRCETFIGDCYISQGDRIQFRANDRELGVNNGTLGTLIETQENCFVVKTDDGRDVAFNPKTFNRYQLGYAGTYHQSQGKTVDHAYALHSPYMTYNLFYVGLTRQKQEVHYIVSKDEAKDLDTLIKQLSRDGSKDTTVRYLTPQELLKQTTKTSVFTRAVHYVKDKLYQNNGFYRIHEKAVVNDETFRGYRVKSLTALEATMAERGDQRDAGPNKLDPMWPDTDCANQTIGAGHSFETLSPNRSDPAYRVQRHAGHPAPQLGEGCLAKLAHHNTETGRYTYTNELGNSLFHVVRLEPKDPSKSRKMTLPLSYGVDPSSATATPSWALKKYHAPDNTPLPLYNLKELVDHPTKPVLIVEGEKTVEAAKQIFPEMVVTTWHGGAGNVSNCNIDALKHRNVILWPDNDAIGQKAMETLAQRCKELGANSIQMVGLEFGKDHPELPEKWDLADPLPLGITLDRVRQKLADLDLPIVTKTLENERQIIVHYMEKNSFSPELMERFHQHFTLYPKDAVEFFKERHPDWNGAAQKLDHSNKSFSIQSDPLLQKALEADKFIRTHERHIINCKKLGDDRHARQFTETLDTYTAELYKDTALWERVDSFEKGTCEHLKALKPEALKAQQHALQNLSRGFER